MSIEVTTDEADMHWSMIKSLLVILVIGGVVRKTKGKFDVNN